MLNNPIARAFNLDVLGVLRPQELIAKTLFDAAALVVALDAGRELLTNPNVEEFEGVGYIILAIGGDLIINIGSRKQWLARAQKHL